MDLYKPRFAGPEPAPYIELIGPNAELWEFNERDDQNYVKGDAAEFCHVVTQGRNIEDVELEVLGGPATEWMKIAQCFLQALQKILLCQDHERKIFLSRRIPSRDHSLKVLAD